MRYPFHIACIVIGILLASLPSGAQERQAPKRAARAEAVRRQVADQRFAFRAEWAQPLWGSARQLVNGRYDLWVSRDSVICFLPYFGRNYSATTVNPVDGGLKFTSTDFSYTTRRGRRKGYEITIRPRDQRDVRQLILMVAEGGSATLQISSNTRDGISYTGYIAETTLSP